MRRTIASIAVAGVVGALIAPGAAPAKPDTGGSPDVSRTALMAGLQLADKKATAKAPTGANPFLALLPDPASADYSGWRQHLEAKAKQRATLKAQQRALAVVPSPILVDEDEPDGTRGSNETPATAQPAPAFGTAAAKNPRARVLGTLDNEVVSATALAPNTEDDGAIPLARDTGISALRRGITTTGTIGDGPHGSTGSGTGDFDTYKVTARAGDTITVDMDTPTGSLDTVVLLFDAAGELIAANDDADGLDSFLAFPVPAAGDYFVMITGYLALPNDPFDSGSGTGAESQGPYNMRLTASQSDQDFFAFRLRKGDVLAASVTGAATRITIFDTVPTEVHGSEQDASFIYPPNTPLPGGGNAVTEHVAERAGWHYVGVSGNAGNYDITVEGFRPGLEGNPPVQKLFLDFDGARLNTAIFGGPGVRTLSPMRAFLAHWGLTTADENAVINATIARVRENIRQDLIDSGLNGNFALQLLNSRDHADPFGQENVSRIVIGGTIDESGVATIGIAQSIDPGNFDTQESALVLLDVLSGPAGDDASLNTYITPASNKVRFVGQALGNVVAHEAGHFFGNWHTDQFNPQANLMDQGGNFPFMFGVGPDNVGGTADDPDVDFGEDAFNPNEGFVGTEDTLSRLAVVLTR
jgi:hypothetical protein